MPFRTDWKVDPPIKTARCDDCGRTIEWRFDSELYKFLESHGLELCVPYSTRPQNSFGYGANVIHQTEGETMLPRANSQGQGENRKSSGNGIPYLKNENLTVQPKEAKILAVRNDEYEGKSQVKVKLALDGRIFFWNLRLNNPNLEKLQDQFGLDENEWAAKKVLIGLVQDEFTEKFWPTVSFPAVQEAKQKPRS
jgi:hypothetical protein